MLHIDPTDAIPIWRQIEEGVRNLVASRALSAGEPVPSVRELARELRINPATVSKAYQRLTSAGVLEVRRGEGTFVTPSPPALPAAERRKRLAHAATSFVGVAITLGADAEESGEAVGAAFDSFKGGRR